MVKLIFATLALAMAFVAAPAQAQWYDSSHPICLHVFGELEGERMDCVFTSLAQCEATASGRSAMCEVNPYFAPVSRFAPIPRRRRH
ncbi:DUF3551 domain-containing protein [Bradyrhizobium sp.]|uniref:DUF3551 domain-containing protein n=1 Tax=Bradyrhizobium sp. TaxID=376 RepID=UPI0025B880AA|nr:DUF3551 domain-containing protein [Bradyrhizobium sp.]